MSSVKDIIKTSFEKGKEGEIHPLTHINKKEAKLKKWLIILTGITFINFGLFLYVNNLSDDSNAKREEKNINKKHLS